MIVRPAVAALGCRSCQNTIYRAVLSAPRFRSLPAPSRHVPVLTRRAFSSGHQLRSDTFREEDESASGALNDAAETTSETTSSHKPNRPWFLDVDPPRHPPSDHIPVLPTVPDNAPEILEPIIKYVYEDMGLDELSLLDLRELDPPPALGPNLIMLFGTARSERHLHVSAGRLVRWLRRNYKLDSQADGLIGPGELRTKLRRLRKKAKLMGTNTAIVPGGDNGISTGWICVNFSAAGDKVGESESFDDDGRFSGFGTPQTGTTIVVQCLTEARRAELDLETLWQGILKRSLEKGRRIRGEKAIEPTEMKAQVASRVQLSTSNSALQWQALKEASLRRYYSTTARRLSSSPRTVSDDVSEAAGEETTTTELLDLKTLQRHVGELQLTGRPFSEKVLENLISAIFQAAPSPDGTEVQRLALVDGLLQTADERGMGVLTQDVLVALIESIVVSPAYGPELQRAQKNFEFLLTETQSALDPSQVLRLMAVYATRHDWDRFWDVFRTPPRFQMRRTEDHYNFVYGTLALTQNKKMCTDALRWVYAEMLAEDPPVLPVGPLYDSLKSCILVADPAAETLLGTPPQPDQSVSKIRQWENREFLIMLRELEAIRTQAVSMMKERSETVDLRPNYESHPEDSARRA